MEFIFVSAPYTHDDMEVRRHRMQKVSEYCLELIKAGYTPISPLNFGDSIAHYTDTSTSFESWSKYCYSLMRRCDEVHVLNLDGWDISTGVSAEIEYAAELGLEVTHIDQHSYEVIENEQ